MATQFPDEFRCPISLEIMSDPVILPSGHTFDRSSIQRWLNSGHRSCPITKEPFPEFPYLIPNHALRSLISGYTHVSIPIHQSNPDLQALIETLISPSCSSESKLHSIEQLSRLSKRDSSVRRKLAELGAVSAALNCASSLESGFREKALHLVLNLSLDDDNKVGLVAEGAIGIIVAALHDDSADCRAVAATILTSLTVVEVNKATIGANPLAIPALISLLRNGNKRETKESATALYALCSFPANRTRVVELGAVPILISLVNSGLERAVEVLGLLAKCREGRDEMMKRDNAIEALVHAIKKGNSRGVQNALFALNLLCSYSERACLAALKEGAFEICVAFGKDDNEKIRRSALRLIHVLRGIMKC